MDVQPLTETTFFILLSLASEAKHGYAIMKDVLTLSEERVVLSTGTLYGALKRLLEQELIEKVEEQVTNGDGRERKAYRLTNLGRKVLEAEVARLHNLVTAAQLRAVGEEA
jgi:DNA-binding PadR family transcriptional regulator